MTFSIVPAENFTRWSSRLDEKGKTLKITRGPSMHELEHALFTPELAETSRVNFELSYAHKVRFGFMYGFISQVYRTEDHSFMLWGMIGWTKDSTLSREDSFFLAGNYSTKVRTGFMTLSPAAIEFLNNRQVIGI